MTFGILYVLPNFLGEKDPMLLPGILPGILKKTRYYAVEEIRSARQLIARMDKSIDIDSLHFHLLNEHTPPAEITTFLEPLLSGHDMAIISEAGCAAVADPGAALVRLAQQNNIRVIPVAGPSSILLALMASGLNGQAFSFEGYLPKERDARIRKIRALDQEIHKTGQTKIFIETPYRNAHLVSDLLAHCDSSTLLCMATDIQGAKETIHTKTIGQWKKSPPHADKTPAIFLLGLA